MIYRSKNKRSPAGSKCVIKMADKKWTKLKGWVCGVSFCALWYLSIVAGFYMLICPLLPLVIFKPKLYRRWSDMIFGMWEPYPVAMMEILFGVRIKISGERFNPFEGSIVIMNHRTRLDWNFLWGAMFHCSQPHAHNLKFVLKAPIMHLPGPGWVMQACSFIFIHRNWEKDQQLLTDILDYLRDIKQTTQMLIFPEGTDLSPRNIERSHQFANSRGLERYYRVLHPKTTGFSFLAHRMRLNGQLQAVYDFTVAYPKILPETESDLLRGKFPEEIHFDIKRYDLVQLPTEEADLKQWLCRIWQEKEQKLQKFYSHGSFELTDATPDCSEQNNTNEILKKCSQLEMNSRGEMYKMNGVTHTSTVQHTMFKNNLINNEIHSGLKCASDTAEKTCDVRPWGAVSNSTNQPNQRPSNLLYLALIFWTSLVVCTVYAFFTVYSVRMWIILHTVLFVALSFVSKGFHHLVASCYHLYFSNGIRKNITKKLQ